MLVLQLSLLSPLQLVLLLYQCKHCAVDGEKSEGVVKLAHRYWPLAQAYTDDTLQGVLQQVCLATLAAALALLTGLLCRQ
jgi:hypothetical protein